MSALDDHRIASEKALNLYKRGQATFLETERVLDDLTDTMLAAEDLSEESPDNVMRRILFSYGQLFIAAADMGDIFPSNVHQKLREVAEGHFEGVIVPNLPENKESARDEAYNALTKLIDKNSGKYRPQEFHPSSPDEPGF